MPKVGKTKWYDPTGERMYILGAVHMLVKFDPGLDDPSGILDDAIEEMLIDAFKFGWKSAQDQEGM